MLGAMDPTATVLHLRTPPPTGRLAFEAFRETFGKTVMRIEVDPRDDDPFAMDMVFRSLPRFGFSGGWLSGVDTHRTPALIDNDDPVLVVILDGRGELEQLGRTVGGGKGDAILTTGGEPGRFSCSPGTHFLSLRLDRTQLASMMTNLDGAITMRVPAGQPVLGLLVGYAMGLESDTPIGGDVEHAISLHVHDLAALLLGPSRDTTESAQRGVRAARLAELKRTIRIDIANAALSVESVAAVHGISASYVRKLLAGEGITFSSFVLGERLAIAHRLIADPRLAARTISALAYEAGFNDLSYFNRSFRRRFGMTPSDLRRAI
jgi:AraC-like DNA-binding protein